MCPPPHHCVYWFPYALPVSYLPNPLWIQAISSHDNPRRCKKSTEHDLSLTSLLASENVAYRPPRLSTSFLHSFPHPLPPSSPEWISTRHYCWRAIVLFDLRSLVWSLQGGSCPIAHLTPFHQYPIKVWLLFVLRTPGFTRLLASGKPWSPQHKQVKKADQTSLPRW